MARLSRILSIAMLVVHLMVGCCAHDAYGCESKHPCRAIHGDATLEGKCAGCRCDHSHRGPRECQGRNWSLASPRRLVGGSFSSPLQAFSAVFSDAHFSRLATSLHQQSRAMGWHLLPVRLHLANQVLLI
ncbi:MAG: hypothetical protein ACYC6N_11975 [Pirellulaceae bacterium]